MSELFDCRICAKKTPLQDLKKLFEREQRKIIKQIQDLTGIRLKNKAALPEHICQQCLSDLELAYAFRNRCLEVNSYFNKLQKQQVQYKNEFAATNEEKEFDEAQLTVVWNNMTAEEFNGPAIINDSKSNKLEKTVPKAKIIKKSSSSSEATKQLICDQCGNNFRSRQHFIIHMRRHAGDKRYNCEICPDKFYTQGELNRHMRRHTGERPFACSHCDRRFTDYSTRKKHERIHTNERPFSCSQCNKSFTTSYVLKNHMLIHTGERSFRCEMCHKSFQRQTHLFVHYRSLMHKQNEEKCNIIKHGAVTINSTNGVT